MSYVFTQHVRHFQDRNHPCHTQVLGELERLLRRRMRRYALLSRSPGLLGYNAPSWREKDAFEDLLFDCYRYAVADRIRGLTNQLAGGATCLDGFITRNVDRFLIGRRQRFDPVGHAVHGNVTVAVARTLAGGQLLTDPPGQDDLDNQSVLVVPHSGPAPLAAPEEIRQVLADTPGWSEVLPYLTRITDEGQEWVGRFLSRLRAAGIARSTLGDLTAVVAGQARGDWAARNGTSSTEFAWEGSEDDEEPALVRLFEDDNSPEWRDQFRWLRGEVSRRIDRLDRQQRVRDQLAGVFDLLMQRIEAGDDGLRQADLGQQLGLPRQSVSDYFRLLRGILEDVLFPEPESGQPGPRPVT